MALVWQEVSSWPPTSSLLMLSPGLEARGLSLPLSAWHHSENTDLSSELGISADSLQSLPLATLFSSAPRTPGPDQAPPTFSSYSFRLSDLLAACPKHEQVSIHLLKVACICVCMHVPMPLSVSACVPEYVLMCEPAYSHASVHSACERDSTNRLKPALLHLWLMDRDQIKTGQIKAWSHEYGTTSWRR